MSEKQAQLDNINRELGVINKIGTVLSYGSYPGSLAQDVAISQMYIQGLAKHMGEEAKKIEQSIKDAVGNSNTVKVLSDVPEIPVVPSSQEAVKSEESVVSEVK